MCSRTGGKDISRPYGKTRKIDFIKVMNRLKDKPSGKRVEVTDVTPTSFGEGKATASVGMIEGLGYIGKNAGSALCQRIELSAKKVYGADDVIWLTPAKAYGIPKNEPNWDKIMEDAIIIACSVPMKILELSYQTIKCITIFDEVKTGLLC